MKESKRDVQKFDRDTTKGKKGRGKGKRGDSSKITKDNRDFNPSADSYGGNDVSWYKRNPELLDAAAKIPFAWQPGRKIPMSAPLNLEHQETIDNAYWEYTYPGFMVLGFYPSVGYAKTPSDPINISAREVYARIRSKYSGTLHADAPDIMLYMLALDSMYMFIEDIKRAYYLINLYSPYNHYLPKALVTALGFNWDDLYENRNQLYQYICEFILKANKFKVPDRMDLFKRHQFMCANIYADSPDVKSQNYAFKLNGYYYLGDTSKTTSLQMRANPDNKTVEDIAQEFHAMWDSLAAWDTGYTINGYLERAYEGEAFLGASMPVYDGLLNPVYNSEVLLQIQNATIVPVRLLTLNITQDPLTNTLISTPCFDPTERVVNQVAFVPDEWLLTMPTSTQPTPDEVTIATRLATVAKTTNMPPEAGIFLDCGTEIIDSCILYTGLKDEDGLAYKSPIGGSFIYFAESPYTDVDTFVAGLEDWTEFNSTIQAFTQHPTFNVGINLSTTSTPHITLNNWQIDATNVSTVERDALANIHRVCIYSEFNCFE